MALTELFHALLVRFIQEEGALFHSAVNLEAQAQTGIFHQLRVDVMDQGLEQDHFKFKLDTTFKKTDERQNICLWVRDLFTRYIVTHLQPGVVWA